MKSFTKLQKRTRNQHYVFQWYLKKWSHNHKQVYCHRKVDDKYFLANTANVAVERDFYSIDEISVNDVLKLYDVFFKDKSNDEIKLIFPFFDELSLITCLKDFLPNDCIEEYHSRLRSMLEILHCTLEQSGLPIVDKIIDKGADFLYRDDKQNLNCLLFVFFQMWRTLKKKMLFTENNKINLINRFGKQANLKQIYNVFMPSLATKLALVFFEFLKKEELQYVVMHNKTNLPFITGDQPVIDLNEDTYKEVKNKMEIYYPLSPRIALRITRDFSYKGSINIFEDKIVNKYNKYIYDYSYETVICNDKDYLRCLIEQITEINT